MTNRHATHPWISTLLTLSLSLIAALLAAPEAAGEEHRESRLGGHVGLVFPWMTLQDGHSTELWEFFSMGVPMGITVKDVVGPAAFDLELVPTIDEDHNVGLTIHPGIIYPTEVGALGMRVAFDAEGDSIGFTPLFARKLLDLSEATGLFVEVDLPVRFPDHGGTSFGVASHVGISF